MKRMIALAIAAGMTVAAASSAEAAQGCGRGFHRGYYGHCRPNHARWARRGPEFRLVIGNYYPGRGYWDGRRYWHRRYRWHGGWRYR